MCRPTHEHATSHTYAQVYKQTLMRACTLILYCTDQCTCMNVYCVIVLCTLLLCLSTAVVSELVQHNTYFIGEKGERSTKTQVSAILLR